MRPRTLPDGKTPIIVFLVLSLVIGCVGYVVFKHLENNIYEDKQHELNAIGDLKVEQIVRWLNERRGDGLAITGDPIFADEAQRWLARGAPQDESATRIRTRLSSLKEAYGYAMVELLDPTLRSLVIAGQPYAREHEADATAMQAMNKGQPALSDLHREPGAAAVANFDVMAPVLADDRSAIAVIHFEIDPYRFLYPYIQSWPTPSASAETLLVRRDGDNVLYLNELRHRKNSALILRLPMDTPLLPGAMVLRGMTGVVHGVDYRGIPVLAALRRIPGSTWNLVAKIDEAEALVIIRDLAWSTALLIAMFISGAGISVRLWWRQQRARFVAAQLHDEHERQALVQHFEYLSHYANDIILLMDEDDRIIENNEAAVRVYGYSREQLLQMHAEDLSVPEAPLLSETERARVDSADGLRYETLHRRGDGSTFPVEISTRAITVKGKRYRQAIGRDISERRQAEKAVRENEEKYRILFETTTDSVIVLDANGKIRFSNPTFSRMFGYSAEEVVGKDISIIQPERLCDKHRQGMTAYLATGIKTVNWGARDTFGLHRDGHEFPIEVAYNSMNIEGRVLFAGYIRDVTERVEAAKKLVEQEERFRQLAENIRDVFWLMSVDTGEGVYISPAYEQVWGRSRESLYKNPLSWLEAVHPEDRERVMDAWKVVSETVTDFEVDYRVIWPDGTVRWVHEKGFPVRNKQGRVYRIAGIAEDITARKEHEEKIMRLTRIYAILSGINSAIVRIRDWQELCQEACRIAVEKGDFKLAYVNMVDHASGTVRPFVHWGANKGFLEQAGITLAEGDPRGRGPTGTAVREKTSVVCNDIAADPSMAPWREQSLQIGFRSLVVFPLIVHDEAIGTFNLYASDPGFFDDEEMRLLAELAGDLSFGLLNIENQQKLDYVAYYDALTGLPNWALFYERLKQFVRSAKHGQSQFAVMMLDIDRFKTINDVLGRQTGDELLRLVAARLRGIASVADKLGRIAYDRFAFVLPGISGTNDVVQVLEGQLLECLKRPFQIGVEELRISVRGGAAVFPNDGEDEEALFTNAESALAKAKDAGEPYLFYAEQMNVSVAERLSLETQLLRALENREFVLHYQPKVNISTKRISGLEALIRWNSPVRGLVPPVQFIPLLEETGLIRGVGEWVLQQAAADYRRMHSENLPALRIAVNISALQLQDRNFLKYVQDAISIDGEGLAPIDLEITESVVMEHIDENIVKLADARREGLGVAIDDFGTGASSLSYLAKLPADTLKIDRSFIIEIADSPEIYAIVSSIIPVAHSLKMTVVAEGVETVEQLKFLKLLKCDEIQGYVFSKPLPLDELISLLREDRKLSI